MKRVPPRRAMKRVPPRRAMKADSLEREIAGAVWPGCFIGHGAG